MTLPWRGAYVVLSLDPASSLKDIDDPIVDKELQQMKCGRYVATATEDHHALSALMPQRTFTWDFLVQGMPPNAPDKDFQSYMTVPVLPNTEHPESRRPVEPLPHLPWENCYHARMYRKVAICETRDTEENPQFCLSPEEAAVLDHARTASHGGRAQDRARKRQEEEAARAVASRGSDPSAAAPMLNGHASSSQRKDSAPSDDRSPLPAAADLPAVASPPAAQATQDHKGSGHSSDSDASSISGPEGMLAALLGLNELEKQLPWVKIESYDIRQFDVPPHPSGFFEELKELKRIRDDYIERQKQRLEDVQRKDADYMASIEARRRSVSGPASQPLFAKLATLSKRVGHILSRGSRTK
ncbi:hypothetical protein K523DRAFT_348118 [Schizophyllum commune Tattone D]|nr:hypothetical protein K523DRAFT_348118 [Schizophyllum commune Tattone D]